MKAFIGILVFCSSMIIAQAQRVCGTNEYVQQLINANPSLKATFRNAEQQITGNSLPSGTARRDPSANEIISIPVVIHVLYKADVHNISEAQIRSQITALNNDFRKQNADTALTPAAFRSLAADTRIVFCLAQVDPQGRKTTGIIRKKTNKDVFFADDAMKFSAQGGDDAWDSKKYLNIWICNMSSRTLGYATPPGSPAERDGVVIAYDVFGTIGNLRYPFNKGRTATHEIGHWMGLKHIWGDAVCGDDGIDDTPSQKSYNFGCPSFPKLSDCSPNANGDMYMNFMDFTDDGCMNMFSNGQKAAMRALFTNTNLRNSFLSSFACDSTLAQGGPLPVDTIPVPAPAAVVVKVLKVYPNPVRSVVTIEYNSPIKPEGKVIRIYNLMGMQVFNGKLTKSTTTLDLSKLAAGVYIVRVGEGKEESVTRIVRQ